MWQDNSALPQKGLGWHGISPGRGNGKELFLFCFLKTEYQSRARSFIHEQLPSGSS